jgi:hypothetical protein
MNDITKHIEYNKNNVTLQVGNNVKNVKKLKCKDFYWFLIYRKKTGKTPKSKKKWSEKYPNYFENNSELWENIYRLAFNVSRETKLQSFQFRINHRILPCKKWLFDIKIKESNICNYCDNIDDIEHFILKCEKCDQFWTSFLSWWTRITGVQFTKNLGNDLCILFGFDPVDDVIFVLNFCVLHAKYYIYIRRLLKDNNINFLE